MLIQALLVLVKTLLTGFLAGLEFVTLPASVASFFLRFIDLIASGASFVNAFIHPTYVYSLLAFLLALDACVEGYHFIMWILKKIPFFNIQ